MSSTQQNQQTIQNLLGDKNYAILCYYKGFVFPEPPAMRLDKWTEVKELFDASIVGELRRGAKLPTLIKEWTKQLDFMESQLNALADEAPGPDRMITAQYWEAAGRTRFEEMTGTPISKAQTLWMSNVYSLIKAGVIKDDDMNGWLLSPTEVLEHPPRMWVGEDNQEATEEAPAQTQRPQIPPVEELEEMQGTFSELSDSGAMSDDDARDAFSDYLDGFGINCDVYMRMLDDRPIWSSSGRLISTTSDESEAEEEPVAEWNPHEFGNCENCGISLTEDDAGAGYGVCESCYDQQD